MQCFIYLLGYFYSVLLWNKIIKDLQKSVVLSGLIEIRYLVKKIYIFGFVCIYLKIVMNYGC